MSTDIQDIPEAEAESIGLMQLGVNEMQQEYPNPESGTDFSLSKEIGGEYCLDQPELIANSTESESTGVVSETDHLVSDTSLNNNNTWNKQQRPTVVYLRPDITKPNVRKEALDQFKGSGNSENAVRNHLAETYLNKSQFKIPRPPNAFMVFGREYRKTLSAKYANETNKMISVRLGQVWRQLPHNLKEAYYMKAKMIELEHRNKYPDYEYNPFEARKRKQQIRLAKINNRNSNSVAKLKTFIKSEEAIVSQDEKQNRSIRPPTLNILEETQISEIIEQMEREDVVNYSDIQTGIFPNKVQLNQRPNNFSLPNAMPMMPVFYPVPYTCLQDCLHNAPCPAPRYHPYYGYPPNPFLTNSMARDNMPYIDSNANTNFQNSFVQQQGRIINEKVFPDFSMNFMPPMRPVSPCLPVSNYNSSYSPFSFCSRDLIDISNPYLDSSTQDFIPGDAECNFSAHSMGISNDKDEELIQQENYQFANEVVLQNENTPNNLTSENQTNNESSDASDKLFIMESDIIDILSQEL